MFETSIRLKAIFQKCLLVVYNTRLQLIRQFNSWLKLLSLKFTFDKLCFRLVLVKLGEKGPDNKIAKSAEHRLLQDLIYSESYNREVRPALHEKDVVKVSFSLSLVQIVDVVSYNFSLLDK